MVCRTLNPPTHSRSRSQFKVMEFALEFRVRSILPLPMEGFSFNFVQMIISVKCYTEPSSFANIGSIYLQDYVHLSGQNIIEKRCEVSKNVTFRPM